MNPSKAWAKLTPIEERGVDILSHRPPEMPYEDWAEFMIKGAAAVAMELAREDVEAAKEVLETAKVMLDSCVTGHRPPYGHDN